MYLAHEDIYAFWPFAVMCVYERLKDETLFAVAMDIVINKIESMFCGFCLLFSYLTNGLQVSH
jgi:hypothetical protein